MLFCNYFVNFIAYDLKNKHPIYIENIKKSDIFDIFENIAIFTNPVSQFFKFIQTYDQFSPKGATSFCGRGSYEYDQIRVSSCLLCLVVQVY